MTKTKSGTMTSTGFRIAAKRSYPDLSCVKLLQGTPFYERQQEMNAWLLAQNDDSMLYNFRKAAGLSVREADPMTGWDADECKLKGHTTGHYMSGLSLAYAATGDKRYRDKLTYLIGSLKECRDAFAGMEGYHEGFLSAYSEEQFDLLEKMTPYPDIWAPYYTLEKIISGLLDAYELADCGAAMDILDPLGSWVFNRLSGLTEELRSKMWDTYIAGEYGFMMSAMLRLYRHTGREEHLEAAKMFSNPKLFDQMAAGTDQLDTMHANQHIPQAIGAQELFIETGMPEYSDIARNFWTIVTGHHCYAIGGTGEQERFHAADSECSFLTESTAESCASYNMLRLTSLLFRFESDDHLRGKMDYFERTLFNHIMMSCSHAPDGGTTYFLPLAPGSIKHYETEENSCCHGTGMESRYRWMEQIFSYEDDLVRINLPVSSELTDRENLRLTFNDEGELTVTALSDMKRKPAVRIPSWASQAYPEGGCVKNGYYHSDKVLKKGESLSLSFPMKTRMVSVPSDRSYVNFARGPYLLAAVDPANRFLRAEDVSGSSRASELRPLFEIDKEPYHIYFRR